MTIQSVCGFLLAAAVFAVATSSEPLRAEPAVDSAATQAVEAPNETILLVSLEDGTIVMQRIRSSADICFKKNSDSATTCLTQGAPVVDPESNAVIGFEMIEETIQLIAKNH